LIVDEAFMDGAEDGGSIVNKTGSIESLIVLRSLGKFFGLAGARLGFVFAWRELLSELRERLGPWTVAGPTRCIAQTALQDTAWIHGTRIRLQQASARLQKVLITHGMVPNGGTNLFQWCKTNEARIIHNMLAQSAVFTRLFDDPLSIRFGLPATEADWMQLENALSTVSPLIADPSVSAFGRK
jgi:cobalamin biosynthetic protein CobC